MRWHAALWMGLVGMPVASAAQDVIYSQPGPGGTYQRYEQYGYGKDARVRLRSATTASVPTRYVVVDPWTGMTMPVRGEATVDEEHERIGPAPAFGTFGGRLVNARGPDPAGLYQGLGPGVRGRGRISTSLPSGATASPGAAVNPPAGARVRIDGAAPAQLPEPNPSPASVPPPPDASPQATPPAALIPPPPPPRLGRA